MKDVYTVEDFCERYGIKSKATARKYMREEMPHREKPKLTVTARALQDWERKNTLPPENETRKLLRRKGA